MSEVKTLVWSRMNAWEAGCYCALVKEVEDCAMEDGFPHAQSDRSLERICGAEIQLDGALGEASGGSQSHDRSRPWRTLCARRYLH